MKWLRPVAIGEGISYLAFALTMPLKYGMDIPEPNKVVGLLHGILFMAYIPLVLMAASEYKWSKKTTFWALAASMIPFGTFVADKRIFKAP